MRSGVGLDSRVVALMVKRALLIAYHYPPVRVSSGIQRTLKFSQYLPEYGWEPLILTVHPRAYEATSDDQLAEIPKDNPVVRACGFDTARHFAIRGRYFDWMALPDRWVSWCVGGVLAGLSMVRKYRPVVLWSTYPIATAHLIGLTLHRITGLPWVADFRDSMTEEGYPRDARRRKVFRWIERHTVEQARLSVFTTPGAVRMYQERYPRQASRFLQIPNGFDEENFVDVERDLETERRPVSVMRPLVLVHSGVLYPSERDPTKFFSALATLKRQGAVSPENLRIVLRATGHESLYSGMLTEYGISDLVALMPAIPYRAALREMLEADGLLIFQASNCNHQVPAKIYEYFRAMKPILALTDPAGDTAGVLRQAGVGTVVPLDDERAIIGELAAFVQRVSAGQEHGADRESAARYARRTQTGTLSRVLDQALSG